MPGLILPLPKFMGPAPKTGAQDYDTTGTFSFIVPPYRVFNALVISSGGQGCAVGPFNYVAGGTGNPSSIVELNMLSTGGGGGLPAAGGGGAPGVATGGNVSNISGNRGDVGYPYSGGYGAGVPGYSANTSVSPAGQVGRPGNFPGGGGSAGCNPDGGRGSGGSSGAACLSKFFLGQSGSPLIGQTLTIKVAAGLPYNAGQGYQGGPSASGRIRLWWQ